ncbi:MAG: arginine/ornithine succinyltransferase subunit alpha [Paraburkholderia sp.]|uniref:arginine/ornithine succinyltransferase subunit alpha n=1 Tax=Paraburkholderia sp. TaxID=1926495 RepID=UPI00120C6547|nr:arginine/ornithine succinyltransferase subunit alpha [Paraburkholderia sp.]TAM04375.1 MAG: arginine/ornithine succinyltransferase subunit alpha [Paraburkholderia sp.]TAM31369.1 MAG: arginine/ornithine succinyltransferase subunit alpha [Paraburkholderia sp.]
MLFVRPARLADLDAIAHMARTAQPVLHSLPHDRAALEARIALSEDSFRTEVDFPGEEFYLFVLEDSATGRLVGTSSLIAAAGYAEPFYAFRNDALIHASRELHVNRKIHALQMSHELTGKSRLAGFYIDPLLRGDAAAHLVSRARMMYVAMNRRRFTPDVFTLLLGVTDDAGVSPFWEAVGRKFFGRDFKDIEMASGGRSRTFIAEVMPAYPIYVPLLPESAQRVLGEPDTSALLAYDIHLEEGFEPDRYVDIFDAGPVLTAQVDRTTSVAANESRVVREAASTAVNTATGASYMVASQRGGEFRCVLTTLPPLPEGGHHRGAPHHAARGAAPLDSAARAALDVQDGDVVRCAPLRRETPETEDQSMGETQ